MSRAMELLNYEVLKKSGYEGYILESAPEKVMQFGEGNFLRAFVDYWFDVSNERAGWNGKCVLVQPIPQGLTRMINDQEGLYTLYLRGRENGEKVDRKRVISSVSRCINPYEEKGYDAMMKLRNRMILNISFLTPQRRGSSMILTARCLIIRAVLSRGNLHRSYIHGIKREKEGL